MNKIPLNTLLFKPINRFTDLEVEQINQYFKQPLSFIWVILLPVLGLISMQFIQIEPINNTLIYLHFICQIVGGVFCCYFLYRAQSLITVRLTLKAKKVETTSSTIANEIRQQKYNVGLMINIIIVLMVILPIASLVASKINPSLGSLTIPKEDAEKTLTAIVDRDCFTLHKFKKRYTYGYKPILKSKNITTVPTNDPRIVYSTRPITLSCRIGGTLETKYLPLNIKMQ